MSPGVAGDNEPRVWVLVAFRRLRHLQIKDGLRNLYQCLVRLARWWATE